MENLALAKLVFSSCQPTIDEVKKYSIKHFGDITDIVYCNLSLSLPYEVGTGISWPNRCTNEVISKVVSVTLEMAKSQTKRNDFFFAPNYL